MLRIGVDRIGVRGAGRPERAGSSARAAAKPTGQDLCPVDGERGVFRGMALLCPRCGKLLGGI